MPMSDIQKAQRVRIIARGGSVHNPTVEEKAMALARGGGTPREQSRLEMFERTGSSFGASQAERLALRMRGKNV